VTLDPEYKRTGEGRPERKRPKPYQLLLYTVAGAALLCLGGRVLTNRLVALEDQRAPRDPATGILIGAEPRELGPPKSDLAVLLVHGFIGSGNNFNDLPDRLADQGWRVKVMLLPGHGTSPYEFEQTSADELLDAVRAELATLRAHHSQVALIGHSMGATLCMLAASETRVDALVMGAPYFGVTYRWFYLLPAETWTRIASPFIRWLRRSTVFVQVNRKEVRDLLVAYKWSSLRGTLTLMEIGRRAQSPEVLQSVTCPVLLVHSHGDMAASPEASARAFQKIGSDNKRAVWLDASNHLIYWDFDRERVANKIIAFLADLETSVPTPPSRAPLWNHCAGD